MNNNDYDTADYMLHGDDMYHEDEDDNNTSIDHDTADYMLHGDEDDDTKSVDHDTADYMLHGDEFYKNKILNLESRINALEKEIKNRVKGGRKTRKGKYLKNKKRKSLKNKKRKSLRKK